MSEPAEIEQGADCEPLLELATPQIYRRNLFRVLGVPVGAAPRDVQRRQSRRRVQDKLGLAFSGDCRGLLSLDPPPSDEEVRAATERLNRPIDRLLDEIFWFWPSGGEVVADAVPPASDQRDIRRAADVWLDRSAPDGDCVAAHNAAVLGHLVALDQEVRLAASGISRKQHERLADLWHRALTLWKAVIEDEEFWGAVRDRARDLNDVQLTSGFVRRVRGTLPAAILLISAKLACAAAERSDAATVRRHVRSIHEADFGGGLADRSIREAIKPLRSRIQAAADTARSRWTREPHHGNRYVRELHEQAASLLAVADAILPKDDLTRGGLHDAVAEAMLLGVIAFAEKTDDWNESIVLSELARQLAAGEAMRSRLAENIQILHGNVKHGNRWYSPGYWDLPEEITESLEAAQALSVSGNPKAAIEVLAAMDPSLGKPLRRCLAFALTQLGCDIARYSLGEYNKPPSNLQKFLNVIRSRGSVPIPNPQLATSRLPFSVVSTFQPACPCCESNHYREWVQGEYRGQRFWMCFSCAASDERERKTRKLDLQPRISEALEYVILADEMDPGDGGVRGQLEWLKKIAREVGAAFRDTKALRRTLGMLGGRSLVRGERHTFEVAAEDRVCLFCEKNAPDDSCRITVPMCGDVRSVDGLFGKGVEYRYGDVTVPRCRRCRDEHRALPARVAEWRAAREAATDDEHFPELLQDIRSAGDVSPSAVDSVSKEKREVAAAERAVREAEAVGTICDRCRLVMLWDNGLCLRCDKEAYRLGPAARLGIAAAAAATIAALGFLATAAGGPELVIASPFGLIGLAVLVDALKARQFRRREQLRGRRLAELAERRSAAVDQAQRQLDRATAALGAAEKARRESLIDRDEVVKRLQAAKEKAVAEFERAHPKPALPEGIKPESAYVEFRRIRKLRGRSWGFGHQVGEDGRIAATEPVGVGGLVACDGN